MAFVKAVQSSPVLRGFIGKPSAWSGGGTVTPTMHGVYRGTTTGTITFTVDTAGTLNTTASIVVSWSDGTRSGILQLGTNAGIAEDDVVQVIDGIGVSFSPNGNTFVAAATFTVAITAASQLRLDHQTLTGDASPLDIIPGNSGHSRTDYLNRTSDGRQKVARVAMLRTATTNLDILKETEREALLRMIHARHTATLYENYDQDTVGMWRASRGLMPLIGPKLTFTRSGEGTYIDADTGLIRVAADGVPRFTVGKNGRGVVTSPGVTNLFATSHATSSIAAWFAGTGSPTVSFEENVHGILDPEDDSLNVEFRRGVQKIEMNATDTAHGFGTAPAVSAGSTYTAQVWLRGRGSIDVDFVSGTTSPPTGSTVDSETVTLDGQGWTRVVLTGTMPGGATRADIIITANEKSVVYIGPKQIEAGFVATSWVPTTLATASRSAESLTWDIGIPAAGTLSFWVTVPPGTLSGDYYLVENTSGGRFAIRWDSTNNELEFWVTNATALVATSQTPTPGSSYHICATWDHSSTAGSLDRVLYVNGASVASDTTSGWESAWGDILQFGKSGGTAVHDWAFQEIRLDQRAWTAAEVLRQYERLTSDEWLHVHRELGGRYFSADREDARDLSTSDPSRKVVVMEWLEADSSDDNLVIER